MRKFSDRFACFLLCLLLVCTLIPQQAKAASFSDVPEDAWYAGAVSDLVAKGIIQGTSATTFSPNSRLTRGAFVTMLAKTVLTEGDWKQYDFKGNFKDVTQKHWANRFVNWAAEAGVVNGYEDKTFKPDKAVSRQEMAVMVVNFANATGRKLPALNEAASFADSASIAKYAAESVRICQQAGVISGYKQDNTFRPNGLAIRAEAASLYSRFLQNCVMGDYRITRKRVYNTPVRAVEFSPGDYDANLVLGRDLVDGSESASSLVSRTGASIAVNAAFFDMKSYMPLGTLIKEGRVLTVDNKYAPAKSAFVMDRKGNFSILNFSTLHTVTLHVSPEDLPQEEDGVPPEEPDGWTGILPLAPSDEEEPGPEAGSETEVGETEITLKNVGFNKWPSSETDATRIIYTRDWGHTLCFKAQDAVTVDENGVIIAVDSGKDVEIPEKGYVLAQRARRKYEGKFFDLCKVGGTIDLERVYEGAEDKDIYLSIGAGPRLVRDGEVCGDASVYQAEGFTDPNITRYEALRVAIGLKKDGGLIIATGYATLPQMAKVLISFGCRDAINFDGGGSANLYVDGFWVYGPQGRALNNMLYFVSKQAAGEAPEA